MNVQPYVFFDGKCEEALEFYKGALGAKVEMVMKFKEHPEAAKPGMIPPGAADKVMHASFRIGDTQIMASDGHCQGKPSFQGFSLTLGAANDAEAAKLFKALGQGGQVQMPMTETFFATSFGMVADKFGVSWMVLAEKKPA
ncbi:MAG: VOC family protein [Proteobacteria bacterium]|nr:VOC family protein [Pseudomonadota bacterium]